MKQFLWNKKCQYICHTWQDEKISISCKNPECCAIRATWINVLSFSHRREKERIICEPPKGWWDEDHIFRFIDYLKKRKR